MNIARWKWLPLIVALPLVACEQTPDEIPDEMPETEPQMEQPAAPVQQSVTVENRMPHVMIVSVIEDGVPRELGQVAEQETQTFTVEGAEGEELELVAQDEAETHTVDHTVEVGAEAPTWTLGG